MVRKRRPSPARRNTRPTDEYTPRPGHPETMALLDGHLIFVPHLNRIPARYSVPNNKVGRAGYQARRAKGTYRGTTGSFLWLEKKEGALF